MLSRWASFRCFLEDGRVCMTNDAAERAIRLLAIGRRNWTFAGSDEGGRAGCDDDSLIETRKLNQVDPHAWLADVLAQLPEHPSLRVSQFSRPGRARWQGSRRSELRYLPTELDPRVWTTGSDS